MTLEAIALAGLAARAPDGDAAELRYLAAARIDDWPAALAVALADPQRADIPLVELARSLCLTRIEVLATALAGALEFRPAIGRAIAYLQMPLAGSRPTVGLLAEAFAPLATAPVESLISGAAIRSGLLQLLDEGHPLAERALAAPPAVALALARAEPPLPGVTIGLGPVPLVPLPPSVLEAAALHAAARPDFLVIRTNSPAEGRAAAIEVTRYWGTRAAFVEPGAQPHGPLFSILRLTPVLCFDLAPGERKRVAVQYFAGPVVILTGPDGSIDTPAGSPVTWRLAVPSSAEREDLWRTALGDSKLVPDLARHHRHGAGRIAHLGRLAQQFHAMRGSFNGIVRDDLLEAAWTAESGDLELLAQPLRDPVPDGALIASAGVMQELALLMDRCRARDGIADGLGSSTRARYQPGVRALFVGPSGTGKTLAAGWIATRLGLPLYRVDLAAVSSKYIGETEKNLALLLARAEQSEVVLLFDEADSLLGRRTDIRDANDRYANQQTNYLLQRLETFDGIAILTSNSRSRFDPAFARRLDVIVEFPMPGPAERRNLWFSHLGDGHDLTPRQLNLLAGAAELTGGGIRNAVLLASVLAHREERRIQAADVHMGVEAEYRKLGKSMPPELSV